MNELEDEEVDENLGSYFECLRKVDKQLWLLDEKHNRQELGFNAIADYSLDHIKESKSGHRLINVAYNYEILLNIRYAEKFSYTQIEYRDTEEEKVTSDMVIKIMNLAYLKDEDSKCFPFDF